MRTTVRGIAVHYRQVGRGRPVLVLHGRPSDHRMMMAIVEPIFAGRRGWRRIYPDLPGMGRTPGADWIKSEDDMLDVVLGLVDDLLPGQRFCVIGGSYGAFLARGVLRRRPEDIAGVLLAVPGFPGSDADPLLPPPTPLVRDERAIGNIRPGEEAWLRTAVVQTPELLATYRSRVLPGMRAADHAFLERITAHPGFSFDPGALPAQCAAPTLILAGRQDANVGYARAYGLLTHLPRATFAVLDRAGHRLAEEQPHLVRALASEWLDRVVEAERT